MPRKRKHSSSSDPDFEVFEVPRRTQKKSKEMSAEQLERRREKDRERTRLRREKERKKKDSLSSDSEEVPQKKSKELSAEQLERRREKDRERTRLRREKERVQLSAEQLAERRKKDRERTRLRREMEREQMSIVQLALRREKDRERTRRRREMERELTLGLCPAEERPKTRELTEEELALRREKDRERTRQRREMESAQLSADKLAERREKDRKRARRRREMERTQRCQAEDTGNEQNRTGVERTKNLSMKQRCIKAMKERLRRWMNRMVTSTPERELKAKVKKKRVEESPEEEDESCFNQWLLFQVRVDWADEYSKLWDDAVALEGIESYSKLFDTTNSTDNPESSSNSNTGSISESGQQEQEQTNVEFQPDQSGAQPQGWKVWKDLLAEDENGESNDEEDIAGNKDDLMEHFLQLQWEETQTQDDEEDESAFKRRADEAIDDWVQRVSTKNAPSLGNENQVSSSPKSNINKKNKSVATLKRFKQHYDSKMRDEKLAKVKANFDSARQRWLQEKPEDTSSRVSTDEKRLLLREKINTEKSELFQKLKAELDQKRAQLESETESERETRLNLNMELAKKYLEDLEAKRQLVQKRKEELSQLPPEEYRKLLSKKQSLATMKCMQKLPEETKKQREAIKAAKVRVRMRMERNEHILFSQIVSLDNQQQLYDLLLREDNREVVLFWLNYKCKVASTTEEMLRYRRKLGHMLNTKLESEKGPIDPTRLSEKFVDFRKFLGEHWEKVKDRMERRRFYQNLLKRKNGIRRVRTEEQKIKANARKRMSYHKKKYGVELTPGEYVAPQRRRKTNDWESVNTTMNQRQRSNKAVARKPKQSQSHTNIHSVSGDSNNSNSAYDAFGDDCHATSEENSGMSFAPSPYPGTSVAFNQQEQGFLSTVEYRDLPCLQYVDHNQGGIPNQNQGQSMNFHPFQTEWNSHTTNIQPLNMNQLPVLQNYEIPHSQQFDPQQQYIPNGANLSNIRDAWNMGMRHSFQQTSIQSSNICQPRSPTKRKPGRPAKRNRFQRDTRTEIEMMRDEIEVPPEEEDSYSEEYLPSRPPRPLSTNRVKRLPTNVNSPFRCPPSDPAALSLEKDKLLPKCEHCDQVFLSQKALNTHMKSHSTLQTADSDPAPPTPTPNSTEVDVVEVPEPEANQNVKKSKVAKKMKWNCPSCSISYGLWYRLADHMWSTHYGKYATTYSCPFAHPKGSRYSNYKFERLRLRMHLYKKHRKEFGQTWIHGLLSRTQKSTSERNATTFLCLYCLDSKKGNTNTIPVTYNTFESLQEHVEYTHEKLKYCCPVCGIILKIHSHLVDHIEIFHPNATQNISTVPVSLGQDTFRCSICESEFISDGHLDQHRTKGHTFLEGTELFRCKECGREYEDERRRDLHFKSCSWKKYPCTLCSRRYDMQEALDRHLTRKHPNGKQAYSDTLFKCELCIWSYSELSTLRTHCVTMHNLSGYLQRLKEEGKLKSDQWQAPGSSSTTEVPNSSLILRGPAGGIQKKNSSEHTCSTCKVSLSPEEFHKCHKAYAKLIRRYCSICKKTFVNRESYLSHNRTMHNITEEEANLVSIANTSATGPEHTCSLCLDFFSAEEFHLLHSAFKGDTDASQGPQECIDPSTSQGNRKSGGQGNHIKQAMAMVVESGSVYRAPTEQDLPNLSASTTVETAKGPAVIWTCKLCLKNWKTKDFLRNHIFKDHAKDAFSRVQCRECYQTFRTQPSLRRHEIYYHEKKKKKIQCPFCPQLAFRLETLNNHVRIKHDAGPFNKHELIYVDADATPTDTANDEKKFRCELCPKRFGTEDGLKYHRTNQHYSLHFSSFCHICGLQMAPYAVKRHVVTHHPQHNPLPTSNVEGTRVTKLPLLNVVELLQEIIKKVPSSQKYESAERHKKRKEGRPKSERSRESGTPRGKTSSKLIGENGSEESEDDDSLDESNSDDLDCFSNSSEEDDCANSEDEAGTQKISLRDLIVRPDSEERRKVRKSTQKRKRYTENEEATQEESGTELSPKISKTKSRPRITTVRKARPRPNSQVDIEKERKLVVVLDRCDFLVEGLKSMKTEYSALPGSSKSASNYKEQWSWGGNSY